MILLCKLLPSSCVAEKTHLIASFTLNSSFRKVRGSVFTTQPWRTTQLNESGQANMISFHDHELTTFTMKILNLKCITKEDFLQAFIEQECQKLECCSLEKVKLTVQQRVLLPLTCRCFAKMDLLEFVTLSSRSPPGERFEVFFLLLFFLVLPLSDLFLSSTSTLSL